MPMLMSPLRGTASLSQASSVSMYTYGASATAAAGAYSYASPNLQTGGYIEMRGSTIVLRDTIMLPE